MQIKIEIELKPEELRRFLGLPDVAGLQDEVVQFLREKVGKVNENFNPADFLKGNLDVLRQSPAWKLLSAKISMGDDAKSAEPAARAPRAPRTPRKKSRRTRAPAAE
ncbi:MAG: DUF6489 family protein [Panacagrimonas sp.]